MVRSTVYIKPRTVLPCHCLLTYRVGNIRQLEVNCVQCCQVRCFAFFRAASVPISGVDTSMFWEIATAAPLAKMHGRRPPAP
jgi:hypothetical protein